MPEGCACSPRLTPHAALFWRAQKRGAPILAEYLGGAITCDAYHMTDPRADGLGVSTCIELAIADARIEREQVLLLRMTCPCRLFLGWLCLHACEPSRKQHLVHLFPSVQHTWGICTQSCMLCCAVPLQCLRWLMLVQGAIAACKMGRDLTDDGCAVVRSTTSMRMRPARWWAMWPR
jgi:hypothetical protein